MIRLNKPRLTLESPPDPEQPIPVTVELVEIDDPAGAADLLRTILRAQAQEIARQEKERKNDSA